jgi:hypothetical protein
MTTCSRCPSPARWRDPDGRQFCGSHVPANGKPLVRLPEPEVPDIVELLRGVAREEEDDEKAAIINNGVFEIRRLRAELDKSGAC